MSELKITISQLENLLDRQKDLVIEALELKGEPIIHNRSDRANNYIQVDKIRGIGQKANYPHDFNILKRYVK